MALTATVQSTQVPTWDETIVPALRKRLEGESRILAKRMSIASVSSVDDSQRSSAPSHSPRTSRDVLQALRHLPDPRKSSAIPRPSLQYSRIAEPRTDPSSSSTRPNGSSFSPSVPQRRTRTYSQPPSPNALTNNAALPTPDSRPTSPRTSDIRPTRIPIAARTRTASTSSHAHSITQRTESRNGSCHHRPYQPPTPDTFQDPFVKPPQPTAPPIISIRHQASSIMNEPAPFATSSIASSIRPRYREPGHIEPRPSIDSEEHPFEHWYRGDVHRNGGVGEVRVAKHVEMLQIANYGHTLRNAARNQTRDFSSQIDSIRGRKRADSVGAGTHESFYLDDEPTDDVNMVLDESPLTDIEADADTDPEAFYDAYANVDAEPNPEETIHLDFNTSTPPHPPVQVSSNCNQTPTNTVLDDNIAPKSSHPPAGADPLRSSTPPAPLRTSAESTVPAPPATGRPRARTRTTSPTSQSSDQSHTKRRAKSPAAHSPVSTPKKAKVKPKTPPPTSRREDPRNSVATYPTPEGDIVNAIPSWTQPVQKSSNWDEVVLPVVARKKGLDGQYEQVFGTPKPQPPESPPVKPAPGTFGYDYTKYRSPPEEEEIQMHEFGRLPEPAPLPEEDPVSPPVKTPPRSITPSQPTPPPSPPLPCDQQEVHVQPDPWPTLPKPPDSPAPFSHYRNEPQVPKINITRPSLDTVERRQVQDDEDVSGGCCKCVIM